MSFSVTVARTKKQQTVIGGSGCLHVITAWRVGPRERGRTVSLAGAAISIIFVATNVILLRQNFCRGKLTFVATNTCLSRQNTSTFVAIKDVFCHVKYVFVATNTCLFLSRQKFYLWQLPPTIVQWCGRMSLGTVSFRFQAFPCSPGCHHFGAIDSPFTQFTFSPLSVPVTSFSIICCPCSVLNLSLDLSSSFLPFLITFNITLGSGNSSVVRVPDL